MKRNQSSSKGSVEKIPIIEKWYGYYTDKTIPEIIRETNKQYNSMVHDFFVEHDVYSKSPKHTMVFFISNKRTRKIDILQYYCAICGFTYSLASQHAIRLHCLEEHRENLK